MKAILLAAGYGSRLRPYTNNTPKCLMPIKGTPILGIWLEKLVRGGVDEVLVNTHYLSNNVLSYIKQSIYSKYVRVTYEEELLGTAGTLIENIGFYDNEDGILLHADNYCLDSIENLIKWHNKRPAQCLITIMTFNTENTESCGVLEVDSNGVVINIFEKQKGGLNGNIANGAIYILSVEAIKIIKKELSASTDFVGDVLMNFLGKIYTYHTNLKFIDIGTISVYEKEK